MPKVFESVLISSILLLRYCVSYVVPSPAVQMSIQDDDSDIYDETDMS